MKYTLNKEITFMIIVLITIPVVFLPLIIVSYEYEQTIIAEMEQLCDKKDTNELVFYNQTHFKDVIMVCNLKLIFPQLYLQIQSQDHGQGYIDKYTFNVTDITKKHFMGHIIPQEPAIARFTKTLFKYECTLYGTNNNESIIITSLYVEFWF